MFVHGSLKIQLSFQIKTCPACKSIIAKKLHVSGLVVQDKFAGNLKNHNFIKNICGDNLIEATTDTDYSILTFDARLMDLTDYDVL